MGTFDDDADREHPEDRPKMGRPEQSSAIAQFDASTVLGPDDLGANQRHLPDRLCRAVVDVLGVDGAAISVYLGADIAVPVGASTVEASIGEGLQFTLREGPCFESYTSAEPVLLPDIDRPDSLAWARFPAYAEQVTRRTSYHGVFAYPLMASGLALGSLSLYRVAAGTPVGLVGPGGAAGIAARVADRLLDAEMITSPDGELEHRWMDGPASRRRRKVWLAQGLTLQANLITPGEAIDLLRAHAFSTDRLLDDLAEDIVSGRVPVPVLASDR